MAATKSTSKTSSAKSVKRSSSAKKSAPQKRQEPAGTGHSPEAVPVAGIGGPKRTKDGYAVAATAGNPHASRAGVIVSASPPSSENRPQGELGLGDIKIATVDGARATLELGKEKTGPLTQSDLVTLRKLLDGAIQETY